MGKKKGGTKIRTQERLALTKVEEFILTLFRLRQGHDMRFMAFFFGISKSHVSRVFTARVTFLGRYFL